MNILVASFPRSGTNLTINTIYLNFMGDKTMYLNIDEVNPIADLRRIEDTGHIYKTHHRWGQIKDINLSKWKVIYVDRGLLDTITSFYFFMENHRSLPDMTMSNFLRTDISKNQFMNNWRFEGKNPVQHMVRHRTEWSERPGVHYISFEDIVSNFDETLDRLAEYLELEPTNHIMPDMNNKKHKFIFPRKGVVGDSKNHIPESEYEYIAEQVEICANVGV